MLNVDCIYHSEDQFHNWDVPYFMTQWDSQLSDAKGPGVTFGSFLDDPGSF